MTDCCDGFLLCSQDVKAVAWHPGGEILVSASYDDSIKLWAADGDEWSCAQTLAGAWIMHTFCIDMRVGDGCSALIVSNLSLQQGMVFCMHIRLLGSTTNIPICLLVTCWSFVRHTMPVGLFFCLACGVVLPGASLTAASLQQQQRSVLPPC